MDDLERSIEKVRRESLMKRNLDDLVEEYNLRLYGPSSDENLDCVEELLVAIEAKRAADLPRRVDRLERRLRDHQAYLVVIGILAVGQSFVSAYGRETVMSWTPIVIGIFFVWISVRLARDFFRRRTLKRKLFGAG